MNNIEYNDISNVEIKEQIINLNKSQLKLIKDSSYLISLGSIIKVQEKIQNLRTAENSYLITEIDELLNHVDWLVEKFRNTIENSPKDNIESNIKEIKEARNNIYGLFQVISGYQIELSYVGQLVDEYGIKLMSKKDYANYPLRNNQVEELINYIILSLDKVKGDYQRYTSIISEIILSLPLRIVKENYFDIVKNSLHRNLKTLTKKDAENIIEDYKKQFDSSIRDGYGTKFDYYFTEIQMLKNMDISSKSLEEVDEIVAKIISLTMELHELFDIIFSIGLNINKLYVGVLLSDIPVSVDVKGIYGDWLDKSHINNLKFTEEIERRIDREINKIEKEINNSLEIFNKLNFEALKREDFDDEELNKELLLTKNVLTIYNDVQLIDYDEIYEETDMVLTDEYLEQIIDSLIQYINRSLRKMNNMERKIRMRKLLSLIQLPFNNIDEFVNYIRYSLDNKVLSSEEIGFRLDYINYYLTETFNIELEER